MPDPIAEISNMIEGLSASAACRILSDKMSTLRNDMQRMCEEFRRDKLELYEEMGNLLWARQSEGWRERRLATIRQNTADQPAGTPTELPDFEPVFARGYAERIQQNPRRRRNQSRAEIRREQEEWQQRRRKWITKDRRFYKMEDFWFDWWYQADRDGYFVRASFFSERLGCTIYIMQNRKTGKCKVKKQSNRRSADADLKCSLYVSTWKAAAAYTVEAEAKAMELLRSKVTAEQYAKYHATGALLERSKKSGLIYIFRRSRPVLVMREMKDGDYYRYRFITALCVHAQGYYGGSWCGTMVPTDDVVAQLLFMRADEVGLWRRSIQHGRGDPYGDI